MSDTQPAPTSTRDWDITALALDKKTGFLEANRYDAFDALLKVKFIEIYKKCFGNVSEVCQKIGVTRPTVLYHMKNDENFKIAVQEAREAMIDDIEKVRFKVAKRDRGTFDRDRVLERLRPEVWAAKHEQSSQPIHITVDLRAIEHYQQKQVAMDAEIVPPTTPRADNGPL